MPAPGIDQFASQYFTGTQASIWVRNVWIDECFGIQFHATQSIVPIYGYASSRFDAVARGKVLVQGVFEINFIDEGYLYSVLDKTWRDTQDLNKATEEERTTAADTVKDTLKLLRETQEVLAGVGPTGETVLPTDSVQLARLQRSRGQAFGDVLNTMANMDIAEADELARELENERNPTTPDNNVIYQMWNFNLKGQFGNPQILGTQHGTFKEIRDCFLVANEMILGSNDEIVKERYSFIGRYHV